MDKSQSYPDIPGAAEYYGEVIKPSEMVAKAFEVIEMQFFAAYGGCTRGYSSERKVAEAESKEAAEMIAKAKMTERGIGSAFYYYTKEAK
jgi:hypothetical protein